MNGRYQASAVLYNDPFIWIRCVGAGHHLQIIEQWALRTRFEDSWELFFNTTEVPHSVWNDRKQCHLLPQLKLLQHAAQRMSLSCRETKQFVSRFSPTEPLMSCNFIWGCLCSSPVFLVLGISAEVSSCPSGEWVVCVITAGSTLQRQEGTRSREPSAQTVSHSSDYITGHRWECWKGEMLLSRPGA